MTDQALDRLIRRLALDAERLEQSRFPETEHVFSQGFERRMRKLLRRGRHPVGWRILRTAACLVLALILSGCAVLAAVPGAREAFEGWVRETRESNFVYRFWEDREEDPQSESDALYQPAWGPPGCRLEFRSVLPEGLTDLLYIDDETGNLASFHYIPDTVSPAVAVERKEGGTCEKVSVNGIPADLYLDPEPGNANVLVWVDEERGRAFLLSGAFDGETLIRMAESVGPVPREAAFRPGWVPDGYEETAFDVGELEDGEALLTYENGRGDLLRVSCAQSYDISDLRPGEAEMETETVLVDGDLALLLLDWPEMGQRELVWADKGSGVLFRISGPLAKEELIRIANSMEAMS